MTIPKCTVVHVDIYIYIHVNQYIYTDVHVQMTLYVTEVYSGE